MYDIKIDFKLQQTYRHHVLVSETLFRPIAMERTRQTGKFALGSVLGTLSSHVLRLAERIFSCDAFKFAICLKMRQILELDENIPSYSASSAILPCPSGIEQILLQHDCGAQTCPLALVLEHSI